MAKPCSTCPFIHTEESEMAQNSGCLPGPWEIIQMKIETGNNWACHSNCNRICQGMVQNAEVFPNGSQLDFTTGELIHDTDVHDLKQYTDDKKA